MATQELPSLPAHVPHDAFPFGDDGTTAEVPAGHHHEAEPVRTRHMPRRASRAR
jgi:hypothetical protein